ncbi:Uncharacterised protein [Slackia heliotrinireducens]|uniref:Uncharacterized protein n=1 Tax=Slackia heliotrinireducens (strain ATCC 29202 / DSM 20476 / NCTC 11029 / RHS 1) TaxID=471855 RepID=C7N6R8_SLAHD|nr:hypothetical protein [Slackia heliotrinireducens]ACV22603.1 hypothetical protein Shel_15840 [Slackia heliotrinireducens DSM 20476]VEH01117.1 Uncharacterised protein [Slackia heliotrinireducens]
MAGDAMAALFIGARELALLGAAECQVFAECCRWCALRDPSRGVCGCPGFRLPGNGAISCAGMVEGGAAEAGPRKEAMRG